MKKETFVTSTAMIVGLAGIMAATAITQSAKQRGAPLSGEDLTLHETTTSRVANGNGSSITSTNYFSRNAMKRTSPDGKDTIIRVDEGRILIIDHKNKTYSSVSVRELNQVPEKTAAEEAQNKEEMEAMRRMMGQVMNSFAVTKIGPGEPIAGYRTEKYSVKGIVEMEIWAAPELKVPEFYYDALKLSVGPNPVFDARKMFDEFKKINGMTLKTLTSMKMMEKDVQIETVVTSVEKRRIPASTFEIPAGYREVAADILR